jgi:hypothetical protein
MEDQEEGNGRNVWQLWGKERCVQGFRWGDPMERNHFEYLGLDGRIILK